MRPTRIKLLFLAVFAVTIAQIIYLQFRTEPYPALMMPSFSETLTSPAGEISAPQVMIVAELQDGGVLEVEQRQLLQDAPRSHRAKMMWVNFKPARFRPASLPVDASAEAALRRWVGERLSKLAGGRAVRRALFKWRQQRLRYQGGLLLSVNSDLGSYELELGHAAP